MSKCSHCNSNISAMPRQERTQAITGMLLSHPKIFLSLKLLLSLIKQQKLWWKLKRFTIRPKINSSNSKQGRPQRWLCAISKIKEMMWKTLQEQPFYFLSCKSSVSTHLLTKAVSQHNILMHVRNQVITNMRLLREFPDLFNEKPSSTVVQCQCFIDRRSMEC